MIDTSKIAFEPLCRFDNTGRIFYAEGRVFRAINAESESKVLEFLNSDLCKELMSRGVLVKTWITDDVSVPGYRLVLEHEPLFCSNFLHWSFEMKKAVAISAAKLIETCMEHGYCVIDPHVGNFAISSGKIVYFDFGSFVNVDKESVRTSNRLVALFNYLPLVLFSKNSGYLSFYLNSFFPKEPFSNSPVLLPYIKKAVNRYDVYFSSNSRHLRSRFGLLFRMVPAINATVRKFSRNAGSADLLKRQLLFKQLPPSTFEKLHNPYESVSNLFPVEDSRILRCAESLKSDAGISFKNVLCVGNFDFSEVVKLQDGLEKVVNVMSQDSLFIDSLFKKLLLRPCRINPICADVVDLYVSDKTPSIYSADLLIMQDQFDILIKGKEIPISSHAVPYKTFSVVTALKKYCNSYLLIPGDISPELKDAISTEFKQRNALCHEGREFLLFEKG